VFIVWGEEDVKQFEKYGFQKPENRFKIKEGIPHCKWSEIPNGTIALWNQNPEGLSKEVFEFIQDIEQGKFGPRKD